MEKLRTLVLSLIVLLSFETVSFSKNAPASFADLAEKLMPSVVNISTTTIVTTQTNPFPFQFPPGSPFEDMFKEFGTPQERKSSALGSGFIIDEKGIVVTNNHVIKDAENINFRTTYLPFGVTPKKSILYAERYTAKEKSEMYQKRCKKSIFLR